MLVDRKCTYPVSSIQFVLSFEIKHNLSWQIENCADSEMAATAWRNALIRQGEKRSAVLSLWWVVLRWMSRYLGPKRRLQLPQVQESHKKTQKHGVQGDSNFLDQLSAEQLQSNERKCWTNCAWPWSAAPLPNFTLKVERARSRRMLHRFQSNNLGDPLQLFRPRTSHTMDIIFYLASDGSHSTTALNSWQKLNMTPIVLRVTSIFSSKGRPQPRV